MIQNIRLNFRNTVVIIIFTLNVVFIYSRIILANLQTFFFSLSDCLYLCLYVCLSLLFVSFLTCHVFRSYDSLSLFLCTNCSCRCRVLKKNVTESWTFVHFSLVFTFLRQIKITLLEMTHAALKVRKDFLRKNICISF